MKRRVSMILTLAMATQSCLADSAGFEYKDCASVYGLSTRECKKITVANDLSAVHVSDTVDLHAKAMNSTDASGIDSNILPIAIPRKGYDTATTWKSGDFFYVKVEKGVANFPLQDQVDVIAVVPRSIDIDYRDLSKKEHEPDVMMNARFAFAYSPTRGVLSIAVIAPGVGSETYHCSSTKCLFGSAQ